LEARQAQIELHDITSHQKPNSKQITAQQSADGMREALEFLLESG
jgi:hypothetical protein